MALRLTAVSAWRFLVYTIFCAAYFQPTLQARYIQGVDGAGNRLYLDDARKPALFTRDFGDCLGSSVVNVTRFDAAYYKDNMTVLFHLQGNTNVHNESLMMYIGVFAYGESRFDLTFNPCNANIDSLCPMKGGVPILANGIIPVAPSDVASIPDLALSIPDFEGQAILRIFANSTQTEIGCYSAIVTNGATFSQPAAVGTVLGVFTLLALAASFLTAVYGDHVPTTRKHYAHSLSVLVIFAVFHHIYFTGAISMNWPSVLPAFWSNYAWAGGMIYSEQMQTSINRLLGSNLGNTSSVGAAGSGSSWNSPQLFYVISSIYQRPNPKLLRREPDPRQSGPLISRIVNNAIFKRDQVNSTDGFTWYGKPVKPGMPLPGNYSGFAGTLSRENIPASNAFLTGFLWLLILLLCVACAVIAFKWILEALSMARVVKRDRLSYFRSHWLRFTASAVLRAILTAFFLMMFLTIFQFSYKGSAGITALAAIVFCIFLVSTMTVAGYACFYRLRQGHYEVNRQRLALKKKTVWRVIPWYEVLQGNSKDEESAVQPVSRHASIPWWSARYIDRDPERTTVHNDEDYILKFGWLAARYRRTRWWFFAVWIMYELVRACFYGGAVGQPTVQVFGLLVVEIIAFVAIIRLRPFEGQRLNTLMVYLLGFSKVATVALSAAFDARFDLPRIKTTIIGIVIIVIQGILTIALLLAIVLGLFSSYMSLTRDREHFWPKRWAPMRERYFGHMEKTASDLRPTPSSPQGPVEPYFNVSAVHRCPKIEDEDNEFMAEISDPSASRISVAPGSPRHSRRNSVGANSILSHTTVPWGARVHRASWSTKDFDNLARSDPARLSTPTGRPPVQGSVLPSSPPRGASMMTSAIPKSVPEQEIGPAP